VKSDERSLNDDVDLGSELLRFSESEFYAYSSFQSKAHVRMISSAEAEAVDWRERGSRERGRTGRGVDCSSGGGRALSSLSRCIELVLRQPPSNEVGSTADVIETVDSFSTPGGDEGYREQSAGDRGEEEGINSFDRSGGGRRCRRLRLEHQSSRFPL